MPSRNLPYTGKGYTFPRKRARDRDSGSHMFPVAPGPDTEAPLQSNFSRMLIELIEIHNVFEAFIRTENLVGFHRRITVENRERLVLWLWRKFPLRPAHTER